VSPTIRLDGRILYLTEDPALLREQLDGRDLDWTPAIKLRDDISTDEITPAYVCYYCDERLGDFPYLGLDCRGEFPIVPGAVRRAGFMVSVSGRRRGKGSSREASPYAERAAGIRLIIAESFERIYRENCEHLGILTSTDFDLLAPLRRGAPIRLGRFTEGRGAVTGAVIEHGGLLAYGRARVAGSERAPMPSASPRPMTLAEKIIARHWVTDLHGPAGVSAVQPGDEGFVRADIRFSHEYVTPMAAALWRAAMGPGARLAERESIFFFRDHLTLLDQAMTAERKASGLLDLARGLEREQREFAAEQDVVLYDDAICHSRILERHALPGQLVVGTDSHTPHSGAIGCLAVGVGTTAICQAWLTRDVRLRVPPSILITVNGRMPGNVTAKDLMLQLLRTPLVREGRALGRVLEYGGSALGELPLDERATLTNMAAEVGALSAIVPPDEVVVKFLVSERGMERSDAERLIAGLVSDLGARYEASVEIDAVSLEPMVALPGDPGNGRSIDELGDAVRIDIAYAGSCTAGKREDMDMYARVFAEALARGERVHPDVRCYVQYGSQEVRRYAERRGYAELFEAVGARVLGPSCGACINAGPGVSYDRETVTVSAINRNFPGRSGPGQVYLASPYTVAASAIAGRIVGWGGG
jgi:3-isopropylmalate/(R)-2-methylmalate dehydratase large subunit